jgi:hypothetical protein
MTIKNVNLARQQARAIVRVSELIHGDDPAMILRTSLASARYNRVRPGVLKAIGALFGVEVVVN